MAHKETFEAGLCGSLGGSRMIHVSLNPASGPRIMEIGANEGVRLCHDVKRNEADRVSLTRLGSTRRRKRRCRRCSTRRLVRRLKIGNLDVWTVVVRSTIPKCCTAIIGAQSATTPKRPNGELKVLLHGSERPCYRFEPPLVLDRVVAASTVGPSLMQQVPAQANVCLCRVCWMARQTYWLGWRLAAVALYSEVIVPSQRS